MSPAAPNHQSRPPKRLQPATESLQAVSGACRQRRCAGKRWKALDSAGKRWTALDSAGQR
eukprot:11209265-Alexandrium_andersonii.AAC.1